MLDEVYESAVTKNIMDRQNKLFALSILERLQKRIHMKARTAMVTANKARKKGSIGSGVASKMINRAEVWQMASYLLEEEMEILRNA